MDKIGCDDNDGKDLDRKQDLFDQDSLHHQNIGGLQGRGSKPGPGQNPAEKKKGIHQAILSESRKTRRDDESKHDGVDDHQEERIEKRPEKAQYRSAVTGLELAADQILDKDPVFV